MQSELWKITRRVRLATKTIAASSASGGMNSYESIVAHLSIRCKGLIESGPHHTSTEFRPCGAGPIGHVTRASRPGCQAGRNVRAPFAPGGGKFPCSYRAFPNSLHIAFKSDVRRRHVRTMPPWYPYSQRYDLSSDTLAGSRVHSPVVG